MAHFIRLARRVAMSFAALCLLAEAAHAQKDCILLQNCDVIIVPRQAAVSKYGAIAVGEFFTRLKVFGKPVASGFSWDFDKAEDAENSAEESCAAARLYRTYNSAGCHWVWWFPNSAALIIFVYNGVYRVAYYGAQDPWTAVQIVQNSIRPQVGTTVTVHWVRNSNAPQTHGWAANQNYGSYQYVQR